MSKFQTSDLCECINEEKSYKIPSGLPFANNSDLSQHFFMQK